MNLLHISNVNNSVISSGGSVSVTYGTDSGSYIELLLQALEMNRKLVAAISKEWESEEQCLDHVIRLIEESKKLEVTVAENLKSR
ncbi:hypothetical protein [Algoriphagus terrigena]|uniref:hypothetical protein n=1 Tax=Algoriphagus terrigena TaxID=344884 RepID=UPI0012F8CE8F|nr:hypothetical protein [Algoriphagus terrigena]